MGPTASGKTELAIELTKVFPCEIISVDSSMVYRGMNIGTAKPSAEQLAIAPHRLIDICDPIMPYSVAKFRSDALREIANVLQKGKIPLLVGGTMLYFKVLQQGISVLPEANPVIRARIVYEASLSGWGKLYDRLKNIDPEAAAKIAPNDSQRIQRALEVYELTGETISKLILQNPPQLLPYQVVDIVLAPTLRSQQLIRIERRFKEMLQNGFIEEVDKLLKRGDLHSDLPSMRAVGYRQVWRYLTGEIDYQTMQQQAIIATRQLAKRQLTWLNGSWKDAVWFDSDDKQVCFRTKKFITKLVDSWQN